MISWLVRSPAVYFWRAGCICDAQGIRANPQEKANCRAKTVSVSYDLEYGSAVLEMHEDAIKPGQKVVIVDDLIATGGTTEAIVKLIEKMGGEVVKICCVMELAGLKGREKLNGYAVDALITYEGK